MKKKMIIIVGIVVLIVIGMIAFICFMTTKNSTGGTINRITG